MPPKQAAKRAPRGALAPKPAPEAREIKKNPSRPCLATESQEQITVVEWAAMHEHTYPELHWLFHPANGRKRNKAAAKLLKAEGVKAGVPDLWLPIPNGENIGLIIEMKIDDFNARPTAEQRKWLLAMQHYGWKTCLCHGATRAIKELETYLKILKKNK